MFRALVAVLLLAFQALGAVALAQEPFPARPLTIVVPFPPGNSSDISMRLIGKHLATRLKQAVIVENRAGAGGSIGAAYAARRPANGYTIVMGSTGPMAISPALRKTLAYDPVKDFDPLAAIAYIPQLFVTRPDGPVKDLPTLIRLAKEKPDSLRYGSSGIGIGLEYQDALLWDTAINRKAELYLVAYDSEFATVSPDDRPVSGQLQGVALLHKQPIWQRPDRPAEGRCPLALLGREKARCHPPTPFGEPWKQVREFGFDHFKIVKADHAKNGSRQRHVAASDGSVSITIIERRFDQVSELGHFHCLA